jgi:undecaprenyl-diphosphatase
MNFIDVIILGIVEGFTEFLPISSTAHLLITGNILGIPETEFFKTFAIAIQLGAILAVVIIYWKKILSSWSLSKKILTAFIPTAIIGFFLYSVIKNFLFENLKTVAWALIIGGIFIIIFEFFQKRKKVTFEKTENIEEISYKKSFLIGVIQALAIIPGVSRSGATIIGGMLSGISRETIAEFSFLLAIPTIASATGYDLLKTGINFSNADVVYLLVGFLSSFIFAWIGVKFLIKFIKNNSFLFFGFYRIILGVFILFFLL